jgi:DNA-directed RNA polymerase subunit RPC12/RpoP
MQDPRKQIEQATIGGAIVGVVTGVAFFGIGLAVLFFMWGGDGGFHDPPKFFKIFASLIALPFVAIGATIAIGSFKALTGTGGGEVAKTINRLKDAVGDEAAPNMSGRAAYVCPRCGAPLTEKADVSPHGDTKCAHCGGWFNIHKT